MAKKKKADPAGKTILIVDDEFGVLEVLEFILSDAGFTVVSAMNGQARTLRRIQYVPAQALQDRTAHGRDFQVARSLAG